VIVVVPSTFDTEPRNVKVKHAPVQEHPISPHGVGVFVGVGVTVGVKVGVFVGVGVTVGVCVGLLVAVAVFVDV
jgi:hypothetical protein